MASFLSNHTLNSLLENQHLKKTKPHHLFLVNLTFKQHQKIKSVIVNSNNCLNGLFSSFDNFHKELSSGLHLVDNFPNCFFFHIVNCKDEEIKNTHTYKLNKIFEDTHLDSKTVVVISDASIKNSVATSILHIYSSGNILAKTIHHTINATSTEAELFVIRCSINQAFQVQDTTHIIVNTDTIHFARRIFDFLSHSYQLQSIAISQDLRVFFNKNSNNSIDFWDCPSKY